MINIGIIGLGAMGTFILETALSHDTFNVICIFDNDEIKLNGEQYKNISIASTAQELMSREDIDIIYIGTPPNTHINYCYMAIKNNKAIWCEKPLATNVEEAEQLVKLINNSGTKAAVNFTMASSALLADLKRRITAKETGDILKIDMAFHYSTWPRNMQKDHYGGWLNSEEQGGFMREVFSHFAFLTYRLFGQLKLQSIQLTRPLAGSAESIVNAEYFAGEIPVHVTGYIGGKAPDQNEWIIYGNKKSFRNHDWYQLQFSTGGRWTDVELPAVTNPMLTQFEEIEKMMQGIPHNLATFNDALFVQKLVESSFD